MSAEKEKFIASLDIGTTTVRCIILNREAKTIGSSYANVNLLYPKADYFEIDPNELWTTVVSVIKGAIKNAHIEVEQIKSLGISTQRATFITWRKNDGSYLHNFITWKDLRAKELVKKVNSYWSIIGLRWAAYTIYTFTRNKKYLLGSRIKFFSNHVSIRLLYQLLNNVNLQKAIAENNAMFGSLDTWLLYKLTGGQTYVTDISNASATALFDPFDLQWSIICKLFDIPVSLLPPVVNNDYNFGNVSADIFGHPIKIGCILSDQSSSMFGTCCFNENDLKITLGTGGFLNVNTSNHIQPSGEGMYPLVGWKLKDELNYILEIPCNDVGSIIQWGINAEFIDDPAKSEEIAKSVDNNDGVYFIAAFSGLGVPINNEKAGTGFVGIKPTTKKAHLIRALLESVVFRTTLCYRSLKKERPNKYESIRIDGGVSKNNFICQMLADITRVKVERFESVEMSALGVAFLTGLNEGYWTDRCEIQKLCKIQQIFLPSSDKKYCEYLETQLSNWYKAAQRLKSWY